MPARKTAVSAAAKAAEDDEERADDVHVVCLSFDGVVINLVNCLVVTSNMPSEKPKPRTNAKTARINRAAATRGVFRLCGRDFPNVSNQREQVIAQLTFAATHPAARLQTRLCAV